ASDLVSVYDENFEAIYVSPSHETLLGHSHRELFAVSLRALVHPDDEARFKNVLELVAAQPRRTASCQYRVRHADGSWRQLEAHLSNLLDDPAVSCSVVNARDVTEAAAAMEALRAREAWFRSLVQHSSDLITVTAADRSITYLSPSHVASLGR